MESNYKVNDNPSTLLTTNSPWHPLNQLTNGSIPSPLNLLPSHNSAPTIYSHRLPASRPILLYHITSKSRMIALINLMTTINYSVTLWKHCGTPSLPLPGRDSQGLAANHNPFTTRTATVVQTQETTSILTRRITDLYDWEQSFNNPPWPVTPYLWQSLDSLLLTQNN